MYLSIIDPKTNKSFHIMSKRGIQIIKNYIKQFGGHKGPCAIGKKGRCVKSKKADGKCEVSPKGRCMKVKSKTSPVSSPTSSKPEKKMIWLPAEISRDPLHHSHRGTRQGARLSPSNPQRLWCNGSQEISAGGQTIFYLV